MSADVRERRMPIVALLLASGLALAADSEIPDMEFLEYLGMWEESDDEWLVFAEGDAVKADSDERNDPAPQGEESTEQDDEG